MVICDINPEMLAVGKNRADRVLSKTSRGYVGFVEGNAECLPFEDNSFDFYTIAFGLRNVTNKDLALKEAYRVLRKGGRLLIMEFSQVQNPVLRSVYDQYSFNVIPKLGGISRTSKRDFVFVLINIISLFCSLYLSFYITKLKVLSPMTKIHIDISWKVYGGSQIKNHYWLW